MTMLTPLLEPVPYAKNQPTKTTHNKKSKINPWNKNSVTDARVVKIRTEGVLS